MKLSKNKIPEIVCWTVIILIVFSFVGYQVFNWSKQWRQRNTRVIIPEYTRPDILDRSGVLLIGSSETAQPGNNLRRYAAGDGRAAAAFLGYTKFDSGREIGMDGIENMIDRRKAPGNPVYVSLDNGVQNFMEGWMDLLTVKGSYEYVYAIALNSRGELIATSQRPVLDINNRNQKNLQGNISCFMPANYVFPVPHNFIRLLTGTDANVTKEQLMKFQLTEKTGVFPSEAKGRFRRLGAGDGSLITTVSFNYVLAYISAVEKKPIPKLQIFSSGRASAVAIEDNPLQKWIVGEAEGAIAALTELKTADESSLYVLLCAHPADNESREVIKSAIHKTEFFNPAENSNHHQKYK